MGTVNASVQHTDHPVYSTLSPVDAHINIRGSTGGSPSASKKFYIDTVFVFPVSSFGGRNMFCLRFPSFTLRPFPAFVCENIEGANGQMPFSLIKWRIIFSVSFVLPGIYFSRVQFTFVWLGWRLVSQQQETRGRWQWWLKKQQGPRDGWLKDKGWVYSRLGWVARTEWRNKKQGRGDSIIVRGICSGRGGSTKTSRGGWLSSSRHGVSKGWQQGPRTWWLKGNKGIREGWVNSTNRQRPRSGEILCRWKFLPPTFNTISYFSLWTLLTGDRKRIKNEKAFVLIFEVLGLYEASAAIYFSSNTESISAHKLYGIPSARARSKY